MRLDKNKIRERIKNTMMETLKMEFLETDEPTLEVTMPVGSFNSQTMGVLHGGATIALAETAAGVASNIVCNENESCYGIQISANHVSTAKPGDTVKATAKAIHLGRSTHVWVVEVTLLTSGRLISTVTVTNFVAKHEVQVK